MHKGYLLSDLHEWANIEDGKIQKWDWIIISIKHPSQFTELGRIYIPLID